MSSAVEGGGGSEDSVGRAHMIANDCNHYYHTIQNSIINLLIIQVTHKILLSSSVIAISNIKIHHKISSHILIEDASTKDSTILY